VSDGARQQRVGSASEAVQDRPVPAQARLIPPLQGYAIRRTPKSATWSPPLRATRSSPDASRSAGLWLPDSPPLRSALFQASGKRAEVTIRRLNLLPFRMGKASGARKPSPGSSPATAPFAEMALQGSVAAAGGASTEPANDAAAARGRRAVPRSTAGHAEPGSGRPHGRPDPDPFDAACHSARQRHRKLHRAARPRRAQLPGRQQRRAAREDLRRPAQRAGST
jgi:hypothetical protein